MTTIGLIFRVLNILLMIGIPIAAGLYIYRRGKGGFRPIWIGAAAFVLSQVGHIPFNQFLMLPGIEALGFDPAATSGISLVVLGIAAGLSAGIFEEIARFLVMKYWLKKEVHTLLPLKYGIGHGGIEAVLLGLFALAALIQIYIFSGEGMLDTLPADQVELARSQIEAYLAVPWYLSLLGAWERVSAMAFHVGASILVYKSVRSKNLLWLVIAVIGHTLLNAIAVIGIQKLDYVPLEAALFVFAVAWLIWAWKIREQEPEDEEDPLPPGQIEIPDGQITQEQLDASRYDK
jgi:uncharacterized membrane protein YhfC